MKVETWLFGAGALFFAPIGVVYGILTDWKEPVGPVALLLTAGLAGAIASALSMATGAFLAERSEAELIEGYLPAQLSDEELEGMVAEAVAETGATEQKQMGQVMSAVMPKVGGSADGKRVSAAVRKKLGS